jgi:phage gpG-like protein
MKLSIKGLTEIRARLDRVRPAEIMAAALAEQAERLAETVRAGLSEPQGAGDHDKPWVRTGALRDSIAVTASGLEAAIGSNDPAAAPQEMGTSRLPPRPFLAPAAAANGETIAKSIADAVAAALRGDAADPGAPDAVTNATPAAAAAPLAMPADPPPRSELYISEPNPRPAAPKPVGQTQDTTSSS